MIYAEELRVGNKFFAEAGGIGTVLSISDNTDRGKCAYLSDGHRRAYSHIIECVESRNQYKPCEIEPIALTPEIFQQLGFELLDREYHSTFETDFCRFYFHKEDSTRNSCVIHGVEILPIDLIPDKLHRLQNLFFALSGKELGVANIKNKGK